MLRLAVLLVFAIPVFADPPQKPVVVARTVAPVLAGTQPIQLDPWTVSQRYVALVPTTAESLTYDYSDPSVIEVVTRNPGERFYGVPFDAGMGSPSADKNWPDAKGAVAIVLGKKEGQCQVTVWGVKDGKAVKLDTITILVGPQPPPVPPIPPGPIPPIPPAPVSSFRVIFNTESATTLTAQQSSVINAKTTRDYLNAKCTKEKNWPDWRSYDPQTTGDPAYTGLMNLWNATKPKVTVVPCWIIEVNGKADILPFPANAAEALATLQTYGGK